MLIFGKYRIVDITYRLGLSMQMDVSIEKLVFSLLRIMSPRFGQVLKLRMTSSIAFSHVTVCKF